MFGHENKHLEPVIRAMLRDDEFLAGGIFQKERYYMKRYGLSEDEMTQMEALVYTALHPETWGEV